MTSPVAVRRVGDVGPAEGVHLAPPHPAMKRSPPRSTASRRPRFKGDLFGRFDGGDDGCRAGAPNGRVWTAGPRARSRRWFNAGVPDGPDPGLQRGLRRIGASEHQSWVAWSVRGRTLSSINPGLADPDGAGRTARQLRADRPAARAFFEADVRRTTRWFGTGEPREVDEVGARADGRGRAASRSRRRPLPQTTRIRTSTHSHVSDRFSPFATQTIPATVHEAPYILDGLLETGRRVREQYADTGGFTDHVFAACSIALAHLRAVLARCYTRRLDALARSTQASVSVAKAINFSLPPPDSPWQKAPLHSTGDASRLTALFLGRIWPICSLVTPCQPGASPVSVRRGVSPRAAEASSSAASRFALASSVSPRFSLMHPRL